MKGRTEPESENIHSTTTTPKKETRAKKATPKSKTARASAKAHRKTSQK